MLYRTSSDIYYLRLLLLHKPLHGDDDNLRYINPCGGGNPLHCTSYQQLTIAHGLVQSVNDVSDTFNDVSIRDISTMQELFFNVDFTWV
jgi:hypothetical protein